NSLQYAASITNDRNMSDKNVVVTFILPEGVSVVSVAGPLGTPGTVEEGGRSVKFKPIAEMRAKESIPGAATRTGVGIELKAERPGKYRVRVEVRSQRSPTAVTAEQETTVLP